MFLSSAAVGFPELVLLLLVCAAVGGLTRYLCWSWLWALGLVACFLLAVLLTPADLLSTLCVAGPVCGLYGLTGLVWTGRSAPIGDHEHPLS